MNNKELVEKLMHLFESRRFSEWFSDNGKFGWFVSGDMEFETKKTRDECIAEIKKDIAQFIGVNLED